jgi:hypothetical protein
MPSFCGLDCAKCDACVATAKNDDAMRAKVAEAWSKAYNATIAPAQINCTGCKSDGVKFYYCENMCEIRQCASGKKLGTCAECPDYSCERLTGFFKLAPIAKENLDALRKAKPSKKGCKGKKSGGR